MKYAHIFLMFCQHHAENKPFEVFPIITIKNVTAKACNAMTFFLSFRITKKIYVQFIV